MRLTAVLLIFFCACNGGTEDKNVDVLVEPMTPEIFESKKWKVKEGKNYPYRAQMLKDLMENQNLRSFNYREIVSLLGKPDKEDNLHLFYRVHQKSIKFFTLHTKTMVIKFEQDSTVNWIKIHG